MKKKRKLLRINSIKIKQFKKNRKNKWKLLENREKNKEYKKNKFLILVE
jgi:hypothetical protein